MRLVKWESLIDGTFDVMFDGEWYRYGGMSGGTYTFHRIDGGASHQFRGSDLPKVIDEQGYTRVEAFRSPPLKAGTVMRYRMNEEEHPTVELLDDQGDSGSVRVRFLDGRRENEVGNASVAYLEAVPDAAP